MGWGSGAEILDEVWGEIVEFVPKKEQKDLAIRLVKLFEEHDADTIADESDYPMLRKASMELSGDDGNDDADPEEDE